MKLQKSLARTINKPQSPRIRQVSAIDLGPWTIMVNEEGDLLITNKDSGREVILVPAAQPEPEVTEEVSEEE